MAYVPDAPVDFHMGLRRTHIKVDYDSYAANLGGRDPTDEWSRDSTSTEQTHDHEQPVDSVETGRGEF